MKKITNKSVVIKVFFFILLTCCAVKKSFSINDALKVKISNVNYSDETIIRFLNAATDGFDSSYDAWKLFSSNPNVPSIYTKIDTSSDLSINAFPDLVEKRSVELFLKINTAGLYTIQAFELGAFVSNASIILEDRYTGYVYYFRNGASITLNVAATTLLSPSRFVLHFSPPTTITSTDVSCNGLQDGSINIQKSGNDNFDVYLKNSNGDTLQMALYNVNFIEFSELPVGNYVVETYSTYSAPDTNYITIAQPIAIIADFTFNYINAASIEFVNNSSYADNYIWLFGDGSTDSISIHPIHQYNSEGTYQVSLIAMDSACSSTIVQEVEVFSIATHADGTKEDLLGVLSVFQRENMLVVDYSSIKEESTILSVYSAVGQLVYSEKFNSFEYRRSIIPVNTGNYIVLITKKDKQLVKKINFIK